MLLNHANSELCGDEDCCHPCTEANQPVSFVTAILLCCLRLESFEYRCKEEKTRTEHWTLNTGVEKFLMTCV